MATRMSPGGRVKKPLRQVEVQVGEDERRWSGKIIGCLPPYVRWGLVQPAHHDDGPAEKTLFWGNPLLEMAFIHGVFSKTLLTMLVFNSAVLGIWAPTFA